MNRNLLLAITFIGIIPLYFMGKLWGLAVVLHCLWLFIWLQTRSRSS
jgi:hypothetical protein